MANHTKQNPGKLALANRLYDDGLTIEPRQSWESITREHIIRLYRETRHWPTVADRLDVPLNSLLIYRSRKYGIDGRSLRAEYLT